MTGCGCRQSMDSQAAAASANFNNNPGFVSKASKLQVERQHFHTDRAQLQVGWSGLELRLNASFTHTRLSPADDIIHTRPSPLLRLHLRRSDAPKKTQKTSALPHQKMFSATNLEINRRLLRLPLDVAGF